MRVLTAREIKQYVQREKAFDCCGGYKIESYGISIFEKKQEKIFHFFPFMKLVLQKSIAFNFSRYVAMSSNVFNFPMTG